MCPAGDGVELRFGIHQVFDRLFRTLPQTRQAVMDTERLTSTGATWVVNYTLQYVPAE